MAQVYLGTNNQQCATGATPSPILCNIFINDWDDRAQQHTLSRFAHETKTGGVVNIPDGYAAILRDLDRLEKWVDRNLTELS